MAFLFANAYAPDAERLTPTEREGFADGDQVEAAFAALTSTLLA